MFYVLKNGSAVNVTINANDSVARNQQFDHSIRTCSYPACIVGCNLIALSEVIFRVAVFFAASPHRVQAVDTRQTNQQ